LSKLELRICGARPLLLSSTIRDDNVLLGVDLTNPELLLTSGTTVPSGTLHIYRTKFLAEAGCVEQISVRNFGNVTVDLEFTIAFGADFSDIFEVRGQTRPCRGTALASEIESRGVTFNYSGLGNLTRRTRIHCSPNVSIVSNSELAVPVNLEPHEDLIFSLMITC